METQLLQVFRTVAHTGSISAAARRLRFTQSAVSRQIAALESEVGVRVFDRLPRGVTLTGAGRALLPYADRILDELGAARQLLHERHTTRLRVGAFPTAVAQLVPEALAAYRAAEPEAELTLVGGLTPKLLDGLLAGETDLAVVSAAPAEPLDAGRFALHHLLDERILLAVARGHPLAGAADLRLADVTDPFVVGSATDEHALLRAGLPDDFRPRVDIAVSDWTGKLGCVAAGLGVALVPALAIRGTPPDVVLLRLHPDDEPQRRVFAALPAGAPPAPAVVAFLAELRRVAAGLGAGDGHRPVRSTSA